MKKAILLILTSFFFLTSCEVDPQDVTQTCEDVSIEEVRSWFQEFRDQNNSEPAIPEGSTKEVSWIGTATLNGKPIFYAMRYLDGIIWCGTGLVFDDMYVAFNCKGKMVEGINWEDLENHGELYSNFIVEEEKEPS